MPLAVWLARGLGRCFSSARKSPVVPVLALAGLAPWPALAQVGEPAPGSLPRQMEQAPEALPTAQAPLALPKTTPARTSNELKVQVKGFRLLGASQAPADLLPERLAGFVGRSMSFAQLDEVIQTVVAAYREQGYAVRALLPQQTTEDGVIDVMVIEDKQGRGLVAPGRRR